MGNSIERIVYPTDFSDTAEAALKRAIALASKFDAELHIVSVVDTAGYAYAGYPYGDVAPALMDAAETRMRKLKVPTQGKKLKVIRQVLEGDVAPEVANYCLMISADLIVMASHARNRVARFFLGSVADRLLHAAPCPMMLMRRPGGDPNKPARRSRGYKKILVPVDFSDSSKLGLSRAAFLADAYGASLHLMHVIDDTSLHLLDNQTKKKKLREFEEHSLQELKKVSSTISTKAKFQYVVSVGDPAPSIASYASDNDIELVVIGSHGRGEFSRLFLGSVVDSVVRTVDCPVFVEHKAPSE